MSMFEFSELKLPKIVDRMSGQAYSLLKNNILALMFTQRIGVFDSESSNDGPWQPLASDTARRRGKKIPQKNKKKGFKILQDDGILRQSMTVAGAEGNRTSTQGDEVSLASNVEYAAIQNWGGIISHPGTKNGFGMGIKIPPHAIEIPSRRFDQFTQEHEKEIRELTQSHLNNPQGAFRG